jgi:hypothetical protein
MYNRIASLMIVAGVGLGIGLLWRREPSRKPVLAVSDWEGEGGSVPRDDGGIAAQTTPASPGS